LLIVVVVGYKVCFDIATVFGEKNGAIRRVILIVVFWYRRLASCSCQCRVAPFWWPRGKQLAMFVDRLLLPSYLSHHYRRHQQSKTSVSASSFSASTFVSFLLFLPPPFSIRAAHDKLQNSIKSGNLVALIFFIILLHYSPAYDAGIVIIIIVGGGVRISF